MNHVRSEVSEVPAVRGDLTKVMARGRSRRWKNVAIAAAVALPTLVVGVGLLGWWMDSRYVVGESETVVVLEPLPGETLEATEQLRDLSTINGQIELWQGAPAPRLVEGVEIDGERQELAAADPQVRDDGLPFSDSPVLYLGDNGPVSLFYHVRRVGWWDRLLNRFGGGATDLSCLTGVESSEVVIHSCFIDAALGTTTFVEGTDSSSDWAAWLFLPPDTAVVRMEADDGSSFVQQPVAGMAVFRLDDDAIGPFLMTALDTSGELMASASAGTR